MHVTYPVPDTAGDAVTLRCSWSPAGEERWRPARVRPLISETALELADADRWHAWMQEGRVTERRAAGLMRTLVFQPFPGAEVDGRVNVDLRIQIEASSGSCATYTTRVTADNTDVVTVSDWTAVLQADAVMRAESPRKEGWTFIPPSSGGPGRLAGQTSGGAALRQLTYPLDLRGTYAIFVCTTLGTGSGAVRMRLSGEEAVDRLQSSRACEEVLWKWTTLDRQHLVIRQPHDHHGPARADLSYVRLVPLTQALVKQLDAPSEGQSDRFVATYWEPYSWAFNEDVQEPLQHRLPLAAFADARVALVDTQIGRIGMKVVYESRRTDPLFFSTIGDPVPGETQPRTDNVGRMQQYTNTLGTELRYAAELGLNLHANFGAGACYVGTPLQGDISKMHPDWRRGNTLRYELPDVRQYVLSLYAEALEIGSPGISIDFCRYPEGIDAPETATLLLRELRTLADEFGRQRGRRIPILVRFPGTGVRLHERFDAATWAREGLVDYLCPSNIQGRHLHIPMEPYFEAVRETACRLLPALDGIAWGPAFPGPFLWRVRQVYEQGAPGIYIYQADARILGSPRERRCMRLLASSEAVREWWNHDAEQRPRCSKGIYLSRPEAPDETWHSYERIRPWLEGVPLGPVEFYLDGTFVNRCEAPPYVLGSEDGSADRVVPKGKHTLRVRARDGDGWLEQEFIVTGG